MSLALEWLLKFLFSKAGLVALTLTLTAAFYEYRENTYDGIIKTVKEEHQACKDSLKDEIDTSALLRQSIEEQNKKLLELELQGKKNELAAKESKENIQHKAPNKPISKDKEEATKGMNEWLNNLY